MDDAHSMFANLRHPIRSHPLTLSPTLDDFELTQCIRKTLKSDGIDFSILINVGLFESKEIEIKVIKNRRIEIRAKHGKRMYLDNLCISRDCTSTYEIREEAFKKKLLAQWLGDDYILITTSTNSVNDVEEDILFPEKIQRKLSPVIDLVQVKERTENLQDRAQNILRYIHDYTKPPNAPSGKKPPNVAKPDDALSGENPANVKKSDALASKVATTLLTTSEKSTLKDAETLDTTSEKSTLKDSETSATTSGKITPNVKTPVTTSEKST